MHLEDLTKAAHAASYNAGWWHCPHTGRGYIPGDHIPLADKRLQIEQFPFIVATKLMLIVSEVSEAMEGHRKQLMDDKLPHRPMIEVELADALIRICDLAGALKLDLTGAVKEKLDFNVTRPDHTAVARREPGGKAY